MRTTILLLSLLAIVSTQAQTQIGRVKTRGRMVNDQHIPGKGLPGTIVSVQGLTDIGVRKSDGTFTIPTEEGVFMVLSVTKQNYILVDADAVPKNYSLSADTLDFVMETPEQKEEDELEIRMQEEELAQLVAAQLGIKLESFFEEEKSEE